MPIRDTVVKIARRTFLIGGAALTDGLVVGYAVLREKPGTAGFEDSGEPGTALNAWVKITPDGDIILAVPRAEMGQGVYTSVAMLIAEELEVDLADIKVEHPDLDGKYFNRFAMRDQTPIDFAPALWIVERIGARIPMVVTGSSYTIRDAWATMPVAGAAAREMLIAAAAERWGISTDACIARAGHIINRTTQAKLSYGELATAAATFDVPANPPLKDPADYRLVGTPAPRVDVPDKVTGDAAFAIDIELPDMLYAAVRPCPMLGGRLESFNAASVEAMPGAVGVVKVDIGVAVVADSYWRARKAVNALDIEFTAADGAPLNSESIKQNYYQELDTPTELYTVHDDGNTTAALNTAAQTIEAVYEVPFLAHACMEPMTCTVRIDGNGDEARGEVWVGSQSPTMAASGVAAGADIERDNVTCHITYMGGGFGRRAEMDWIKQAAQIARTVQGRPVKLIWSREDDIVQDMYRPVAVARFKGGLDTAGQPVAWSNRIVSQPVTVSFLGRSMSGVPLTAEQDLTMTEGATELPYRLGKVLIEKVAMHLPINVGNWRSVGHSFNAFFKESFIDELAVAAQSDPYQYRRELLADAPKHRAVLDLVAERSDWDTPRDTNQGRGIALHESFGTIVAQVADVTVSADGSVRVDKVVCALDCGSVINPDTVEAQIESGIVFGLSAALYGEITIEDGRIKEQNFPQYDVVRLKGMPIIETHIVPSTAYPGGIGEPGTPPIAAAVTNAIYDAVGVRVRRLPIKKVVV
ncbi:MAG: xanthine dehydrogenase family protein molybdopterin-binding subunit [Gammaproteobacteria bacterium]|jgi:isoquinoline 1-oxidoreductase beta subunit|nr:xanthine dehydrogenase family protein molybdopterin-binding subunit [Gammaproteobacteria bacterium]